MIIFIKQEDYKIPVLTENATGNKLLLPSSTSSIPFSSSCSPTSSSSSAPSILSSLCFPFSFFSCISLSFLSDSSHGNYSSSESWLSIPASFSNTTVILCMSFLNSLNLLRSSNFLEISVLHSASVCCFNFLAFDLLAISALAFACALSTSKGLQAALALVQGAQKVAWLQKEISGKRNNSNDTYGKFWGMQSIPKSTHLLHRLPPPTTNTPISLANSSRRWQASGISFSRYWTYFLLVRDRRLIRFISSSGGVEGGKKVFTQFFQCCCSTAATWSASRWWARSL